jgi:hypothetical protein
VGPNLLGPTANLVSRADLPPLSGEYAVAFIAMAGAGLATLLMPGRDASPRRRASETTSRTILDRGVAVPLAAMVAANFTMVAVMTMTPVHAQLQAQSLQMVGVVISAHMLGMFALSPISGWLADRRGGASAICFGVGTLATASVVAAVADPADTVGLSFGVFLLGLGWNLCWVGGSSLLARQAQHRWRAMRTLLCGPHRRQPVCSPADSLPRADMPWLLVSAGRSHSWHFCRSRLCA